MARGGWLQYSILAKGSKFADAIQLCRAWNEFWYLNILAIYQYFPSTTWGRWAGDRLRQQMLRLGFIVYFQFTDATNATQRHQTGSRRSGPRVHAVSEARNVICAHIKRNDPVSRRFVQYLSMLTYRVVLLVRDAKTGKILVQPPEEECWLVRDKTGMGRASKNAWNVRRKVGIDMFEEVSGGKFRDWHFGYTDYYDVIVWDLEAGLSFASLYSAVQNSLAKANRFCKGSDLYEFCGPIITTLTRDKETFRVRDIIPGENVSSVYDEIFADSTRFLFFDSRNRSELAPDPDYWYNEVDAEEDSILFPEETLGKPPGALHLRVDTGAIGRLENSVPDFYRFVNDLDTDEEDEDDEAHEHRFITDGSEGVEEDEEWEDEDEDEDACLIEDTIVEISEEMESELGTMSAQSKKALVVEKLKQHPNAKSAEERDLFSLTAQLILTAPDDEQDMEKEFKTFLNREKSRDFKEAWHAADLQPNATEMWAEMTTIVKEMVAVHEKERSQSLLALRTLMWLGVHPKSHRRITPDMDHAVAMMSMFLDTTYKTEAAKQLKDSLRNRTALVDNVARAADPPDRRMHNSNRTAPADFWTQCEEVYKKPHEDKNHCLPREWDALIRPKLAHLFRTGMIGLSYLPHAMGTAVMAKEPGRGSDVYFDYRGFRNDWPPHYNIRDPETTIDLVQTARHFASENSAARFALLRVWSAPHCYPLMLGVDNRALWSFNDAIGRRWEWKFLTKDIPGSEFSMQIVAETRIKRFEQQFRKQVEVKRDMFLVMGKDEEDLRKYATAVTFAVQTDPWRLEIDLWRSFANVDFAFLEGLDSVWTK